MFQLDSAVHRTCLQQRVIISEFVAQFGQFQGVSLPFPQFLMFTILFFFWCRTVASVMDHLQTAARASVGEGAQGGSEERGPGIHVDVYYVDASLTAYQVREAVSSVGHRQLGSHRTSSSWLGSGCVLWANPHNYLSLVASLPELLPYAATRFLFDFRCLALVRVDISQGFTFCGI
jgi:hypothetical protein